MEGLGSVGSAPEGSQSSGAAGSVAAAVVIVALLVIVVMFIRQKRKNTMAKSADGISSSHGDLFYPDMGERVRSISVHFICAHISESPGIAIFFGI